jgi:hypothetical protein
MAIHDCVPGEGIPDDGIPIQDDALTVEELINRLGKIRLIHGGDIPVVMCDYEPVCLLRVVDDNELYPGLHVIVTDRFGTKEDEE